MDDIKIASKNKKTPNHNKKSRRTWQYLFDVIIKTLLCTAILSINFTLFAKSGSYSIFSSSTYGNLEAIYIYAGIGAISFILVFISSLIRPLENILISALIGLFTLSIINQFATFDKQSGLLLLFNNVFSEQANIILYEHFYAITFAIVFVISWFILSLLNRSFLFYVTIGVCAVLGWLISDAYLNPQIRHFNDVAGLPNLKKETMGKNLIFLSFNNLTSINNIKKLGLDKTKNNDYYEKTYKNAVGFYHKNNFTIYPNALVDHSNDPSSNLVLSYNANDLTVSAEDNILQSIFKETYFDFSTLQNDKIYLKNNALYDMLRKQDYKINVFQTRDIDTCYVNNELSVSSCKEKINSPVSLNGEEFNTLDKVLLLTSQWLESTKLINSINPLLKLLEYGRPYIPEEFSSKGVDLGKIYSLNSTLIFDQLINTIDKLSGNQAYFAIIDLPSDNYVYDEFCKVKYINFWTSSKNNSHENSNLSKRKEAYAEQLNCLYGSLEKFIEQLNIMGELENTTIIIQGLNNPIDLIGKNPEFYKQIQNKRQVAFAIRHADNTQAEFDYSVCSVPEIINSIFFSQKKCTNFAVLKTSEKNIETSKKTVDTEKLNNSTIQNAVTAFKNWFNLWRANNDFQAPTSTNTYIDEAPIMENTLEDIPEEKMKSISIASDNETNMEDMIDNIENIVKEPVKEEKQEATEKVKELENDKKPSTVEEIAKKTFKEINAQIDKISKDKKTNKKENLINKINNTAKELSSNIDNTIKNVTDKVVDAFDSAEKIADKKQENKDAAEIPIIKENKNNVEKIIAKTKKAIKQKEEDLLEKEKTQQNTKTIEKETTQNSEELRSILEAPVAEGQNLSPEELKKIYHQKIKNAVKNNNIKVEIIEN